jgi:hypothetical protein
MLDSIKGRFPIEDNRVDRNRDGAGKSRADLVALAGNGRYAGGVGTSRQGLPAMALKTCSRRHMAGCSIVGLAERAEGGGASSGLAVVESGRCGMGVSRFCDWGLRGIWGR